MSATVEAAKDIGWKSLFAGLAAFASTAVLLACYAFYNAWIARKMVQRAGLLEAESPEVALLRAEAQREQYARWLIGETYGALTPETYPADVLAGAIKALEDPIVFARAIRHYEAPAAKLSPEELRELYQRVGIPADRQQQQRPERQL